MTKRRVFSICIWAFSVLLLTAAALLRDTPLAIGLAGLLFFLPFASLLPDLIARKKTEFRISLPATAEKQQAIRGTLTAENRSRLLPGECWAAVTVENLLTGETQKLVISVNPLPRRTCEAPFTFTSAHCGTLRFSAEKIRMADWLGVFSIRAGKEIRAKCTVLPDTFPMEPHPELLLSKADESEVYSQLKPGNDPAEIFDLREYAPGDDIRRIHYKLSAKTDQLTVRTYSLPIERSLLLYWDRVCGAPAEKDTAAECIVSLGQALLGAGQPFSLGWRCPEGCRSETAQTPEDFSAAVIKMLGAFYQSVNAASEEELFETGSFGKIIYFTAGKTGGAGRTDADIRFVRCAKDAAITPENYAAVFPRTDL